MFMAMSATEVRRSRQINPAYFTAAIAIIALVYAVFLYASRSNETSHTSVNGAEAQAQAPFTPQPLKTAQASWQLPMPLSREAAFISNKQIFVAGGIAANKETIQTVFRINPTNGAFLKVGDLASDIHDSGCVSLTDQTLLLGGSDTQPLNAIQQIKFDGPQATTKNIGTLKSARSDAAANFYAGNVFLAGGYDGKALISTVDKSMDGTTFENFATLPTAVKNPSMVVVGDQIWVIGGETATAKSSTQLAIIDGKTGSVAELTLSHPISHTAAFVDNGTVYVVGGITNGKTRSDIQKLDSDGQLTKATSLPYAVSDAPLINYGDAWYLLGGESPTRLKSVVQISH